MADIKRMRYFDQQLLVLDDFTDEQAYHIAMRQRHNQLLHTAGIAKGLVVNKTAVKEIKVTEGMAINEQGQEISLDKDSDAIKLDEFASGDKIIITIRYKPVEDSPTGDPPQNRRILERAELKKIKEGAGVPIDKSEVQLARITMGAADIVEPFDLTVRRVAGASAFANPEADFVVRSVAFSSPALPNTQWPRLSAGAAHQVNVISDLNARNLNLTGALTVAGALSTQANANVNGNLAVGVNLSAGNNVSIGVGVPENSEGWSRVLDVLGGAHTKLSLRTSGIDARVMAHESGFWGAPAGMVVGTKGNHPLSFVTNAAARLTIQADGDIGIGTPTPDRKLTIARTGQNAGIYANIKNENHEVLIGVDNAVILSAMTASDIQLRTNNVNRVFIKANTGNVGIGNSDPQQKLHVAGNAIISNTHLGEVGHGPTWAGFCHRDQVGTTSYSLLHSNNGLHTLINKKSGGGWIGFRVDNVDKMVILDNGHVGIGNTNPVNRPLMVEGLEIHSGGSGAGYSFANRNTGSFVDGGGNGERWVLYAADGVARIWSAGDKVHFRTNGQVVATSFQQFSDENLKTGIEPLVGVLDRLKNIRAASFEWNEHATELGPERGRREIGLIAQDLEATFPEVVSSISDESYKTIDYGRVSAVLVAAVKELLAKNEALAKRIEDLEGFVGQPAFQP